MTRGATPKPHEFVVMPNHVHGIVWLAGNRAGIRNAGRSRAQRSLGQPQPLSMRNRVNKSIACNEGTAPLPGSLSAAIRQFKSIGTRRIRRLTGVAGPVWQRSFHERVIRNEMELEARQRYILDNPRRWREDPLNPSASLRRVR